MIVLQSQDGAGLSSDDLNGLVNYTSPPATFFAHSISGRKTCAFVQSVHANTIVLWVQAYSRDSA